MRYHGRSVELVIRTALADTVRGYCAQRPYRAYHHASSIMATTNCIYVSGRYEDYYDEGSASYCLLYRKVLYCVYYARSIFGVQ